MHRFRRPRIRWEIRDDIHAADPGFGVHMATLRHRDPHERVFDVQQPGNHLCRQNSWSAPTWIVAAMLGIVAVSA
ncbi:hypothetical protein [Streptomyces kaempferi]|uniref:Uncharacterized protein n=1 Tax=Streptomyces kaempferi TaxID=333725 RepID=A0ABW3XT41_9ACTN